MTMFYLSRCEDEYCLISPPFQVDKWCPVTGRGWVMTRRPDRIHHCISWHRPQPGPIFCYNYTLGMKYGGANQTTEYWPRVITWPGYWPLIGSLVHWCMQLRWVEYIWDPFHSSQLSINTMTAYFYTHLMMNAVPRSDASHWSSLGGLLVSVE